MDNTINLDHAVIIHFNYGIEELDPLHNLERKLAQSIKDHEAGEYDGHEIAMDDSDGFLYVRTKRGNAI